MVVVAAAAAVVVCMDQLRTLAQTSSGARHPQTESLAQEQKMLGTIRGKHLHDLSNACFLQT